MKNDSLKQQTKINKSNIKKFKGSQYLKDYCIGIAIGFGVFTSATVVIGCSQHLSHQGEYIIEASPKQIYVKSSPSFAQKQDLLDKLENYNVFQRKVSEQICYISCDNLDGDELIYDSQFKIMELPSGEINKLTYIVDETISENYTVDNSSFEYVLSTADQIDGWTKLGKYIPNENDEILYFSWKDSYEGNFQTASVNSLFSFKNRETVYHNDIAEIGIMDYETIMSKGFKSLNGESKFITDSSLQFVPEKVLSLK